MGKSSSEQTSQSQSQTAPWQPAQANLQGILSGINSQLPNYQTNPTEQQALTQLTSNSQNLPNFGTQAGNVASSFLAGDPSGLLKPALSNYQAQLNPIANQNNDPMQTPGIQNLLNTIRSDVSNSVNGQFAGAGRDLSGLNQQTLARGISQGEAAPLLAQYNQNVSAQTGAAGNLYNAAGNTASALGNNQTQGFNLANNVPGLTNQAPLQTLAAQAAARGLPLNNLGMLANLTVPIAGLGGQSSGSSVTHGTQTMSPIQAVSALFGGGSNSAASGAGSSLGTALGILGAFA